MSSDSTKVSKESPASIGGGGIASHLLTKTQKYEIIKVES
jgi:hypothetical protein